MSFLEQVESSGIFTEQVDVSFQAEHDGGDEREREHGRGGAEGARDERRNAEREA